MGSGRSVSACLSLVTWALVSQETNGFETTLRRSTKAGEQRLEASLPSHILPLVIFGYCVEKILVLYYLRSRIKMMSRNRNTRRDEEKAKSVFCTSEHSRRHEGDEHE